MNEKDGFLRWTKQRWERIPLEDQRQKVAHALQYKIRSQSKEDEHRKDQLMASGIIPQTDDDSIIPVPNQSSVLGVHASIPMTQAPAKANNSPAKYKYIRNSPYLPTSKAVPKSYQQPGRLGLPCRERPLLSNPLRHHQNPVERPFQLWSPNNNNQKDLKYPDPELAKILCEMRKTINTTPPDDTESGDSHAAAAYKGGYSPDTSRTTPLPQQPMFPNESSARQQQIAYPTESTRPREIMFHKQHVRKQQQQAHRKSPATYIEARPQHVLLRESPAAPAETSPDQRMFPSPTENVVREVTRGSPPPPCFTAVSSSYQLASEEKSNIPLASSFAEVRPF